jgi:hypothetical protein
MLTVNILYGQLYVNGQDPFSIKWKQIKTKHFTVIFSDDISAVGVRYAGYLEKIYLTGGKTLNHNPRKIPVIIHSRNSLSNGEVAWAPRRMNLYTVPSQTGYITPYYNQLALHEFRHVVQIDKLNSSNTKFLYYLFGEQAVGAVLGWHVPRWFLEGDAVTYETGASNGGRGRQPDFSMWLKAQTFENGIFSYPKAQFGSYKDFVPDHYKLGYQLVTYARKNYSYKIWDSTLNIIAHSPIHPNAFSKGIKRITGLPERKFYKTAMQSIYKNKTTNTDEYKKYKAEKDYINYYSPHWLGDNKIICYKTSYGKIPEFTITDKNGIEKKLFSPGYISNNTFSYHDSILVWNEFKRTRWENENYNKIVIYNLKTNKKKHLTKKTRAYYSRLSPDTKKIVSVEVCNNLQWAITIRNAENGKLTDSILFAKDCQPIQPDWSPDMRKIVFLILNENGKSVNILDLNSHSHRQIFKSDFIDISNPVFIDNSILLKGVFNKKTNLLLYNLKTKKWHAITNVEYGVGQADLKNNKLVYSDYTPYGYKIKTVSLQSIKIKTISFPEKFITPFIGILKNQEHYVNLNNIDTSFEINNYSRLLHLFNVHSWAPLGINIQNYDIGPGVTAMSQNALSTSVMSAGWQYNVTDKSNRYFVDYSYKGFFPVLNVNISKTYYQGNLPDNNNILHFVKWSDLSIFSSIILPLNFDCGKWYRRIQLQVAYEYRDITPSPENDVQLTSPKIHGFYYGFYFSNMLTTAYRDLISRWGQTLNIIYRHTPFKPGQMGELASVETRLYFPGIFKNHGLGFYGAYQQKEKGDYSYSDIIRYPYGYESVKNDKMYSAHFNYRFPLLYPDLNIFEYLYIKRIKLNLFYQYSAYKNNGMQFDLQATGADLSADMHIFRFVFPVDIGIRYSRRITYGDNYYGLLFKMNF